MDIKVIDGLSREDVVERFINLDERAAYSGASHIPGRPNVWYELTSLEGVLNAIYYKSEIAIIDTTTPEIDCGEFDWPFFRKYGGLYVTSANGESRRAFSADEATNSDASISESPFYYWPGGEQPVPDNVEVEVVLRHGGKLAHAAGRFPEYWKYHRDHSSDTDYIAFKLTGRVL